MMRWLLDTDHASLQDYGHPQVLAHLAATPGDEIAISPITVEEMLRGWLALLARRTDGPARIFASKLLESVLFCARTNVVPFDEPAEARYQALLALRRASAHMTS